MQGNWASRQDIHSIHMSVPIANRTRYTIGKRMAEQPLLLVVDDEPDFVEIFGAKLSRAGFRVEGAMSGEEGIRKTQALKPDLVLLDVKMPGMSGAEMLFKLKENPATRDVRVVFITSMGDPRADVQDVAAVSDKFSREAGALGYVRKSDDLDKVVEQVRAYLSPREGGATV